VTWIPADGSHDAAHPPKAIAGARSSREGSFGVGHTAGVECHERRHAPPWRRRTGGRRAGPARVFLGLTEIAGYYRSLGRGLRVLGVESDVITLYPHVSGYDVEEDLAPDARAMVARVRRILPHRPDGRRPVAVAKELLVRGWLLIWAARRYDTFVFGFRNTFLAGWDLPLLRLMGKQVICVFHGSDSRPPYIDRQNGEGLDGAGMVRWVRRRSRLVRRLERWSDQVVVGGLTTQLHRRRLVCFQALGAPVPLAAVDRPPRAVGAPVRVVHAPSHLATKGTLVIRRVIDELQAEGLLIDYRELVGRPNREVLAELAEADLLVDQLYSDTFLGGLGAEAAAVGCPSVVGGYELDLLAELVAAEAKPPGYYCRPDALAATIRAALEDDPGRRSTGLAAMAFVRQEWSPEAVAARFLRVLARDEPEAWLVDPARLSAHLGCGVDRATAAAWVRATVDAGGPSGLGVDDKPTLRAALVAMTETSSDGPGDHQV
jgi:hypothetical protein